MMKLSFHGAVGTVTGSRFLLETATTRVLIDCGLFQGIKVLRRRNWRPPGFRCEALDAVVLTHAHIDHSGYLPGIVRRGFAGEIHCTPATRDLCRILLPDSGRIQEEEARYANRKRFSRHKPALPLYTERDADNALRRFAARPFTEPFEVGDIRFTYHPSGHILGAASVVAEHQGKRVLFSGDLGRPDDLLMYPPATPPAADVVVMESTYGDRNHPTEDPVEQLGKVARRTLERGGVLLVPAFAVGRAQAMLYALEQAFERGLAPRAPVYLNSPMATRVSELYLRWDELHRLSERQVKKLFASTHFVGDEQESRELNRRKGPMVIVSASGMLTGGRVLHHLRAFGHDPSTTILLPGYQAAGTRGAKLLAGARHVKVHGTQVVIRAEIAQLSTYSAHADQQDLLGWLGAIPTPPREVLLVHGEPQAADTLRGRIEDTLGFDVRAAEEETLTLA